MSKRGRKKKGGKGWISGIGITALLIFLIVFTNAVGYIGNALADPANRNLWLGITAIVCITTGIIEYLRGD